MQLLLSIFGFTLHLEVHDLRVLYLLYKLPHFQPRNVVRTSDKDQEDDSSDHNRAIYYALSENGLEVTGKK